MDPLASIQASMSTFTKKERLIAEAILKDPLLAVQSGMEDYAQTVSSSKSAFIRMCQKLGYDGYSDFRFSLSRYLISTGSKDDAEHPMKAILQSYSEYILQMAQTLREEELHTLASMILSAHRIKMFGINRTGLSANQLRMRITKLGIDAEAITDQITMRDVSELLHEGDLCIIFSSKAMAMYQPMIRQMKEQGATVVLLTMTAKTPLKKDVDLFCTFPFISRSSSESFLDDQAIFFVFIEVLLNEIARNNNA